MSVPTRALDHLRRVFLSGVRAVQPVALFEKDPAVKCSFDAENNEILEVCGEKIIVSGKRIHLVGFGKAVLGMAVQVERVLGGRLQSGILSVPVGTGQKFAMMPEMQLMQGSVVKMYEGAPDNLPDKNAMKAAAEIKKLAESMTENDVLFVLISGGGSALLPSPVRGITLEEKLEIIKALVAKGATIVELNIVRISLSQLKGGKLGECAKKAFKVITFVISDIVGDPLDLIASGPTIPFKKNSQSAKDVLRKYRVWDGLPEKVRTHIQNERQTLTSLENSCVHVLGSNKIAASGCFAESRNLGHQPFVLSTSVEGNVVNITTQYTAFLKSLQSFITGEMPEATFLQNCAFVERFQQKKLVKFLKTRQPQQPICFILSGEPTVEIKGDGVGGRSQELALRMALEIHETPSMRQTYFLSAGTDGIDGPTVAAGAIGCHQVVEDYLEQGTMSRARGYLERNDSYNFYSSLKDGVYHIITGHTGTNTMDLHLILVLPFTNSLKNKL